MKKQILFITIVISVMTLFSCSKSNMELTQTKSTGTEQSNAAVNTGEGNMYINPLTYKLDGCYPFNGNLNDATGKLAPGVSFGLAPQYTTDHKGFANSALRLTGNSFVKLYNVPQQTAASISVWVRTFDLSQNLGIVSGNNVGLMVFQNPGKYVGGITLPAQNGWTVSTGLYKDIFNLNWHHLVVTYDGSTFKFYVDAALAGSSNFPGTINQVLVNYIVGNGYWKGAVDDLRFYSRTLSASDVSALYSL